MLAKSLIRCMRERRHVFSNTTLLAALVLVAACTRPVEPTPRDVIIVPAQARYSRGDTVRVIVSNQSDRAIGFAVCFSSLERLSNNLWTNVVLEGQSEIGCGDVLIGQAAHQTSQAFIVLLVNGSLTLPESLSPGTYRVVIPALYLKDPLTALSIDNRVSSSFEVQ